ncbi:hypothetical protein SEA_CLUBPENGUIN_64 [Streptomyces phage ClubPenguin]|nr:hypothetical protein SEA_CLUBPENGUIN_64 [Streptomyces phage ClubPenguin]
MKKRALVSGVVRRNFAIGMMCGESWYRLSSWRNYPLVWKLKNDWGFGIGPILIWSGK